MATRGTRDGTRFQINGVQYYTLIEADGPNKGRITIKSPTLQGNTFGANSDRTVGFISPSSNSYEPSTTTNPEEIQFFSSPNGQRQVKNQAVITSVRSGLSEPEARQLIFPNTAQPTGTTPPASGDPASTQGSVNDLTPADLTSFPIESSIENTRTDFGSDDNLRYPIDLNASKQDCIKFSMETNEGRSLGADIQNQPFGTLGSRVTTTINGSVVLPIQSGITDSNGVEWGGANLDPKDRYLASLALKGITSSSQGLAGLTGDLVGKVIGDLKNAASGSGKEDFKSAFNLYLAQEAVGIQGLLSRTSGAIVNPNLELLFNGPTLRSFTFTFRLSPRSEKESANVRRIIRYFKEGMVVKTAAQEVFLKSPNIFTIQYLSNNTLHKSLPRIKKCALLGCDVDYTPDGTYMTFNDDAKTMTSYQLSLRFSELEPLYSKDYKEQGLQEDAIGY